MLDTLPALGTPSAVEVLVDYIKKSEIPPEGAVHALIGLTVTASPDINIAKYLLVSNHLPKKMLFILFHVTIFSFNIHKNIYLNTFRNWFVIRMLEVTKQCCVQLTLHLEPWRTESGLRTTGDDGN